MSELPGQEPLFGWDEYEDDEWNDGDDPLLCLVPDDCPLGPEPHQWVPPGQYAPSGPCCCRQPWEEDPPRPVEDLPPL